MQQNNNTERKRQALVKPKEGVELILLVIQKDSFSHLISNNGQYLWYSVDIPANRKYTMLHVGVAKNIIGFASQITEEEAKDLVKKFYSLDKVNYNKEHYHDYVNENKVYRTAIESLKSLIESCGLTVGENEDVLILKKI